MIGFMDDNTFECPHCGAAVYPEMTRCPRCGQNMYPEDEESEPAVQSASRAGWFTLVGTLVIGSVISAGIAFLLNFITASFQSPSTLGVAGTVVLWLAGPIGALVAGYVVAGILPQHVRWLGVFLGVLLLPLLVLFATHWVEVTGQFLLSPWVIAAGVVTVLAGGLGSWLNNKFSQDTTWKEKWQVRGWEDLLYQDLLRKVRFNGSAADRLIEYERQQDPQASRLKLIQSAIERWERDNR